MARFHHWAAAAALAAMASAVPAQAQAQARCWADREVAAAQVRDMQTLLMVAALRCRAAHIDISADYDGFVTAQKAAIDQADLVIKQHFAQAGGAQADYDHFATSLANGFGDDETTEATCGEASALAHEASAIAPAALGSMALARVFPAALPGGPCGAPASVSLAMASAPARPEALPPMIALAAPEPETQPVTLPADVVAAMTVMARFQASQAAAPAAAGSSVAAAPVQTAQTDEAPAMAPVQTWQVAGAPFAAAPPAPVLVAAIQR
jgi:hypothetical protein